MLAISMVEHSCTILKALGSIPAPQKDNNKTNHFKVNNECIQNIVQLPPPCSFRTLPISPKKTPCHQVGAPLKTPLRFYVPWWEQGLPLYPCGGVIPISSVSSWRPPQWGHWLSSEKEWARVMC
jgi:hypothetical protein